MAEEPVIDPKTVTSNTASFRKIEAKYIRLAREKNLPLCVRCLKYDYDLQKTKDWQEYTKAEEIRFEKIKDKKTHKILGKMVDYVCPVGHGISVENLIEDVEGMVPVLPSAANRK